MERCGEMCVWKRKILKYVCILMQGFFWNILESIGRNFGGFYSSSVSVFLFMREMHNDLIVCIVELRKV